MISLPTDPNIRALIEARQLVYLNRRNVRSMPQAKMGALDAMKHDPTIRAIHTVCAKADGSVVLLRVGPKGGHKVLWRFGDLTGLPA